MLTGACDPLFMPRPLGPFVDVARTMGGTLDDLVRSGPNPYSFAEALVEELTRPPPTIVLLEDVHWADEATLDVIRFVAGRIERLAALVVVTYRDDELGRDASSSRRPRKPGHGSRHSPRQGAAALSRRRRRPRRSVRRRCRRAVSADFREPVLRHRGAGDAPRPGAGDRSRRRARPCRAAQRRRKAAPRRPVCPPVRRRRRLARSACRSLHGSADRHPRLRNADNPGRRAVLPTRARAPDGRGCSAARSRSSCTGPHSQSSKHGPPRNTIWRDSRTTPTRRAMPLRCSYSLLAPLNKRPHSARTGRPPASTGERFATRTGSLLRNARRSCRGTRASAI